MYSSKHGEGDTESNNQISFGKQPKRLDDESPINFFVRNRLDVSL